MDVEFKTILFAGWKNVPTLVIESRTDCATFEMAFAAAVSELNIEFPTWTNMFDPVVLFVRVSRYSCWLTALIFTDDVAVPPRPLQTKVTVLSPTVSNDTYCEPDNGTAPTWLSIEHARACCEVHVSLNESLTAASVLSVVRFTITGGISIVMIFLFSPPSPAHRITKSKIPVF